MVDVYWFISFYICDIGAFSLAFWGDSEMLLIGNNFFARMRKNIFLDIVLGNATIRWVGIEFATLACFRLHSGAVLKCCFTSAVFSHACEKNISLHCAGGCPNLMVRHRFHDTGAFSLAF